MNMKPPDKSKLTNRSETRIVAFFRSLPICIFLISLSISMGMLCSLTLQESKLINESETALMIFMGLGTFVGLIMSYLWIVNHRLRLVVSISFLVLFTAVIGILSYLRP